MPVKYWEGSFNWINLSSWQLGYRFRSQTKPTSPFGWFGQFGTMQLDLPQRPKYQPSSCPSHGFYFLPALPVLYKHHFLGVILGGRFRGRFGGRFGGVDLDIMFVYIFLTNYILYSVAFQNRDRPPNRPPNRPLLYLLFFRK